ncbi:DUF3175 domain-containing protein [Sulfuricystis multivorans]|uniref:DUF3175 domain-containing protein n=1 Tax=Sulfuricystis multivorans TaxID=2211108 RepID=UPI000F848809|nr:DUF3175 domain-containing protein [Sulfuricystis multivorans]
MDEKKPRRWSQQVTETSFALDLEAGVFTWDDPAAIARSLAASAEASTRRKASPFQSAMSMLNFYINRAGRKLPSERRAILEAAKDELRRLYGRSAPNRPQTR